MIKGILAFWIVVLSAYPVISSTWARTYTQSNRITIANSIEPTNDGGFLAAGTSYTSVSDVTTYDIVLMKVDSSGNLQWQKTYGGNNRDVAYSAIKTSDGGFLVVGTTRSFGAGGDDFWILKLNSAGDIQWQNTFGTNQLEAAYSAAQTSDGGYIVAGRTDQVGQDSWVLKLNSSGGVQWQRIIGYFNFGEFTSTITPTSDGGYALAISSPMGGWQTILIKLTSDGLIQWQKSYKPGGVALNDQRVLIQQTSDQGYAVLTQIWEGSIFALGFLKTNSSGALQSFKMFQFNNTSYIRDFDLTSDGGYIIAGANNETTSGWLVKLNSSLNIQWAKSYSGNNLDDFHSVHQLSDGGYIVAGSTKSFGSSSGNFWILKLDSTGSIDASCTFISNISPSSSSPTTTVADTTAGMLGTFLNPQVTSITPTTQSVNTLEQCSDGGGCPLITIAPSSLPDGVLNISYSQTINASGGTQPYTYSVSSGALPGGFGLNSGSGLISGTPTTVQTANFQITATDSAACTGTRNYTVDINATCLLCDNFNDGIQPGWLITKQNFTETGGNYVGTPTGRKAETFASPVFAGCSVCSIEAVMNSAGGALNKVWLLVFYIDKNNVIELLMDEPKDTWVLKQRVNKSIVAKAKGSLTIDPNIDYVATVNYDGTNVNVLINGSPLITIPAVVVPNGTVGFRVKNTVARFNSITVN